LSSKLTGLLPHVLPMLLVDELISSTDDSAVIGATIRGDYPFSVDSVGTWVGLELMAQSAAVLSKLRNQQKSEKPSLGFLLGSRSYTAYVPEFSPGQQVLVEIRLDPESLGQATITASGAIRDTSGQLICEGILTLFEPNDDALYLSK
jgi:predicted hotdog family 3-hydroxylacyl-ACP dehydratase